MTPPIEGQGIAEKKGKRRKGEEKKKKRRKRKKEPCERKSVYEKRSVCAAIWEKRDASFSAMKRRKRKRY